MRPTAKRWGSNSRWVYDFFDHNAPITVELPEPRVDLPDPNGPTPPHPTPHARPHPDACGE